MDLEELIKEITIFIAEGLGAIFILGGILYLFMGGGIAPIIEIFGQSLCG